MHKCVRSTTCLGFAFLHLFESLKLTSISLWHPVFYVAFGNFSGGWREGEQGFCGSECLFTVHQILPLIFYVTN